MIDIDNIPHILKYMGGKREMLNDIHLALATMEVNSDTFCDLFAGTSIVAYAMSDEYNLHNPTMMHATYVYADNVILLAVRLISFETYVT